MTKATKKSEIKREWHLVDAKDQVFGRLASEISPLLIGKSKSYYVRNLDCGDYVVVINAKYIKITGRKLKQKQYGSYSGYPGGLKLTSLKQMMEKSPEEVIRRAILGMLPDNKLKSLRLKRLFIFPESDHQYQDKFQKSIKQEGNRKIEGEKNGKA